MLSDQASPLLDLMPQFILKVHAIFVELQISILLVLISIIQLFSTYIHSTANIRDLFVLSGNDES